MNEAAIDRAVARFLTLKFQAGLFDDPWPDLAAARTSNTAQGVALARLAAEKSLVLLQNDGALPLSLPADGTKPTIAVIGPNADVAHLGGYAGEPRAVVTPLQGIRELVGDRANIVYSKGVVITEDDDWWADEVVLGDPAANRRMIEEAVAAARDADTVVLFIGDTQQTSREGWAPTHLGDRTSLDLVGQQNELVEALAALGKPLVTVLVNGRPPSYPTVVERSNAVLEAWYAGEQQGHAIADALFGRVNPGGKLPVTVARNVGQVPLVYNHKPTALRGYLFDETTPLFRFGHGLSYTSFDIAQPRLSAATVSPDRPVTVTTRVTNTGPVAGDEVVQLYITRKDVSVTQPVLALKGFERITLAPGESREVSFTLMPADLAIWNRAMEEVNEPGPVTVHVGPSSDPALLKSVEFEVQ